MFAPLSLPLQASLETRDRLGIVSSTEAIWGEEDYVAITSYLKRSEKESAVVVLASGDRLLNTLWKYIWNPAKMWAKICCTLLRPKYFKPANVA